MINLMCSRPNELSRVVQLLNEDKERRYVIVEADEIADLVSMVNLLVKDGWTPCGRPWYAKDGEHYYKNNVFRQAIYRYEINITRSI